MDAGRAEVVSVEAFHRALHREWSRSLRVNLPVSLAVIEAAGPKHDGQRGGESLPILAAFIKTLGGRLRCTDLLGWHEPGKLGVLLPHTTGAGAWLLIADVQSRVEKATGAKEISRMVEIKVYSSS